MQIELRPGQPGRPHVFIAFKKLINFPAGNVAVHPVNPEGELPVKSTLFASVESGKFCLTAPLRLQARIPIVEKIVERVVDVVAVERSEEHTSELQSRGHLVCRLLLE